MFNIVNVNCVEKIEPLTQWLGSLIERKQSPDLAGSRFNPKHISQSLI